MKRTVKELKGNRIAEHLGNCSLEWHCCTAQNLFYRRWEAGIPASPVCNANCFGCISLQPAECCESPQSRIKFRPTPEEIAEVGIYHLQTAPEGIISFGQGCEGEPSLAADNIAAGIGIIRKATDKGQININTNAGYTEGIRKIVDAGLDTMLRSQQAGPEQETFVEFIFSIGERKYRLRRNPDYLRKSKRQTKDGSGLTAEHGWRYDAVFRCVKTDFFPLTRGQADLLENYVLEFGIRGFRWRLEEDWPYRRSSQTEASEEELLELERVNLVRRAVANPLSSLEQAVQQAANVREITRALYDFLQELAVPDTLAKWAREAEQAGRLVESREHRQIWDDVMELMAVARHPDGELLRKLAGADPGASPLEYAQDTRWDLRVIPAGDLQAEAAAPEAKDDMLVRIARLEPLTEVEENAAVRDRLEWHYDFRGVQEVPAKLSVTELKQRFSAETADVQAEPLVRSDAALFSRPAFLREGRKLAGNEYGTIMVLWRACCGAEASMRSFAAASAAVPSRHWPMRASNCTAGSRAAVMRLWLLCWQESSAMTRRWPAIIM